MAVRKKSTKRAARKTTQRARKAAKRKPAKRTARKRASRVTRKRSAKKSVRRGVAAKKAAPPKLIDLSAAPRCRSRIPVEIEIAGRLERCAIVDMSSSGARIVGVKLDVPPGTPLRIRYPSTPVAMDAEFVRVTADGFAAKILRR